MTTNKKQQETAARQEMMEAMPLTMRGLYRLGCFKDLGLKWKRGKDGKVKPAKWTITPRWYHPLLLVWVVLCSLLFGIADVVKGIWVSVTDEIVINPLD